MSKSEIEKKSKEDLTEWQIRNLEFLEKKRDEEAKEKAEKAAELEKRLKIEKETEELQLTKAEKKALKKAEKKEKKSIKLKEKREKRANGASYQSLLKALPVLFLSFIALAFSLFTISPYGSYKILSVKGETYADPSDLLKATRVKRSDYLVSTFMNTSKIEQNVVNNSPWVKSAKWTYSPLNQFVLTVKEHDVLAYEENSDGSFSAILDNGEIGGVIAAQNIPKTAIFFQGNEQKNQSSELAKQLKSLSKHERQNIQTIAWTPSKATKDLVTISLADGNTLLSPLSAMGKKLPYYTKIANQLTAPTTVDMEVGIYVVNDLADAESVDEIAKIETNQVNLPQELSLETEQLPN